MELDKEDLVKEAAHDLLEALKELSNMYAHAWDLSDGSGLIMMQDSIPKFEAAHAKARRAISKAEPSSYDKGKSKRKVKHKEKLLKFKEKFLKLTKPELEQLSYYLSVQEREECYYGNKEHFKKRHANIKAFLEDLISDKA